LSPLDVVHDPLDQTVIWPWNLADALDWIEQGLTSHQTHCRSYWDGFLQVIWPNQQRQSTEWR